MEQHERAGEREAVGWVTFWLIVSVAGSVWFATVYAAGPPPLLPEETALGIGLAFALLGLAGALVVWSRALMPHEQVTEERPMFRDHSEDRDAAAEFDAGLATIGRRPWLVRLGLAAGGCLGVAALFPLRSFGSSPEGIIGSSRWRAGARFVQEDGTPVTLDRLAVGSVITAFPEGESAPRDETQMTYDMLMVMRVPEAELRLPADRAGWAPQGVLAYSKVCTHAGCPVALYRADSKQLFCPCHQSTFDVLDGGSVIFGPAARALPQLPVQIQPDGRIAAAGELSAEVGPDTWDFPGTDPRTIPQQPPSPRA